MVSQIYRILWDSIVTLKILPGQLVSEKEIATALSASKTPVREALIRLEDSGLVTVIPKSGTYVTSIRIDAYIEGCFIRLQLETGAVRRAAERNGVEQYMTQLDTLLQKQSSALKTKDYVLYASLDEALHETFFVVAGLHGVWHFLKKTQADVNRIRHLKRISGIRRGKQVIQQHSAIVDAIKAGDPQAAGDALVAHIGSLESEIEQLTDYPELLAFIENQNTTLIRKLPGRRNARSTHSQQAS
ncbi:hypothetical protein AB833_03070 [Chromatiales bacterium (ex Bugula neritina AB1)]|nr:hypothetical protein AB833_03070 [Chromatiales bacterium (ex Bugula neritina AB1)]